MQTALTMLPEKWIKVLDDIGYAGAVLMDLSKAFDTINHELLIAKLHAYGFGKEALTLIADKCHLFVAGHKFERESWP